MKLLSYRNNFNPVSVRVINKVNSHRRVFVADTAHLFMLLVECIIVICFKCKMEFFISKVIRFLSVSHPCKFQIESCSTVTEIDDFETAITIRMLLSFFRCRFRNQRDVVGKYPAYFFNFGVLFFCIHFIVISPTFLQFCFYDNPEYH